MDSSGAGDKYSLEIFFGKHLVIVLVDAGAIELIHGPFAFVLVRAADCHYLRPMCQSMEVESMALPWFSLDKMFHSHCG